MTAKQQAAMLATAQALAARKDCPTLPDTYVVSKGEPVEACWHCGWVVVADAEGCLECGRDGESWHTELSWPDAVRLPDLRSRANGGVLLGALRAAGVTVLSVWLPSSKEHPNGGYHVTVYGHETQHSEHLAHAAALAWLVLP